MNAHKIHSWAFKQKGPCISFLKLKFICPRLLCVIPGSNQEGGVCSRPDRKKRCSFIQFCLCIFGMLSLLGCQGADQFQVTDLAKTDINQVSEIHLNRSVELMKELTRKLYKKNPNELKKAPGQTVETRIRHIFTCPQIAPYTELKHLTGTPAILLGLDPEFDGDRVFAIMVGLHTMIRQSYNNKCELFMLDFLNEQNLYNSARNVEILVWRLKSRSKGDGSPFLLTNSLTPGVANLSYERLFGKLISLQDTMAEIVSQRTGRLIKEVVQIASMSFMPVNL